MADVRPYGTNGNAGDERAALGMRDGWQCAYCGVSLLGYGAPQATVDHVVARSRGGSNRADNKVLACQPCNKAKGSGRATDEAFLRFVADRKVRLANGHGGKTDRGDKWRKKGYVPAQEG